MVLSNQSRSLYLTSSAINNQSRKTVRVNDTNPVTDVDRALYETSMRRLQEWCVMLEKLD